MGWWDLESRYAKDGPEPQKHPERSPRATVFPRLQRLLERIGPVRYEGPARVSLYGYGWSGITEEIFKRSKVTCVDILGHFV